MLYRNHKFRPVISVCILRPDNLQILQFLQFFPQGIDMCRIFFENTALLQLCLFQQMNTRIDTCHQYVRRTARLQHIQIPLYFPAVHPLPVHMQQRCLRQGRKRLMKTIDHKICAIHIRTLREIRIKTKMRPMRFVYDQQASRFMYNLCNLFDVRHHAVIGR